MTRSGVEWVAWVPLVRLPGGSLTVEPMAEKVVRPGEMFALPATPVLDREQLGWVTYCYWPGDDAVEADAVWDMKGRPSGLPFGLVWDALLNAPGLKVKQSIFNVIFRHLLEQKGVSRG